MSANFYGGWTDFKKHENIQISDIVLVSELELPPSQGIFINDSDFSKPTGGTWDNSPISIDTPPAVYALNEMYMPQDGMLANAINVQTKTYEADVPPPLRNLIFAYGNQEKTAKYKVVFNLNLGGLSYNKFQISIIENAVFYGDHLKQIPIIDYGIGPFTGTITINFIFAGYYGLVSLGIRLECTTGTNKSSLFELKVFILPIRLDNLKSIVQINKSATAEILLNSYLTVIRKSDIGSMGIITEIGNANGGGNGGTGGGANGGGISP